jgi:hypothetical protein
MVATRQGSLFTWGAIFILFSGIIYTADSLMKAYVDTKQIGITINMILYERNEIVPSLFALIGISLWVLSIIKKER